MNDSAYIPIKKCIHGALYLLKSRNLSIGIYNKPTKGFIGIRTKFYDRFLFTEYHWDLGAENFGTAKPVKFLEQSPYEGDDVTERYTDEEKSITWSNPNMMEYLEEIERREGVD